MGHTLLNVFVALGALALCNGHGAIVLPRSRNAVDHDASFKWHPAQAPCTCSNGTEGCSNGQACYWYNQGCFIGCPTCDNLSGRAQYDICHMGKNATLNDPQLRTVNRRSPAGSALDIYKHNPWRAPGNAPVSDPCGLAGGTPWTEDVSEWGEYATTTHAQHGDHGTLLPKNSSLGIATWKIGSEVEVMWQITANHGGGYQYRMCLASSNISEACFRQTPLAFNQAKQQIVLTNGTRISIAGSFVSEGTEPAGSTWAMNPIPPTGLGADEHTPDKDHPFCKPCPLPVFDPKTGIARDCTTCDNTPEPAFPPPCSLSDAPHGCQGNEGGASVSDMVVIPSTLAPGEYILQWRLDCEATAQVWTNCADVNLVA